ncbi:MAG: Lrp/AsnC family transcriptional regulator [bacterium]|nr:Lrp/AsnC family transcriptional regulator [bacterium]
MYNFNLDETSLKILALLQRNARISYSEIGRKIGLSTPSVKERVQKLEEHGVITGYVTKIDNAKLGYPIVAITSLICSGAYTQKEQYIVDMLKQYPQVLEILRFTGRTDISIMFCARTIEECKIITDKLGQYGKIETSFVVTNFLSNLGVDLSKTTNIK